MPDTGVRAELDAFIRQMTSDALRRHCRNQLRKLLLLRLRYRNLVRLKQNDRLEAGDAVIRRYQFAVLA